MAETKGTPWRFQAARGAGAQVQSFSNRMGCCLCSDLVALVNAVACLQHRNVFSMAGPVAGLSPQNARKRGSKGKAGEQTGGTKRGV